jgi:putative ABC transport system substrate-binding protein
MTTAPNGELRRQDLHLQVQQLVSLRSLLWGRFVEHGGLMA